MPITCGATAHELLGALNQLSVHVASLKVSLFLPDVHSLKEKRGRIRPVIDGLQNRFSVSVAEVDHQDLWQRCDIGIAVVGSSVSHIESVLEACDRFVWSFPEFEVTDSVVRWLDED